MSLNNKTLTTYEIISKIFLLTENKTVFYPKKYLHGMLWYGYAKFQRINKIFTLYRFSELYYKYVTGENVK